MACNFKKKKKKNIPGSSRFSKLMNWLLCIFIATPKVSPPKSAKKTPAKVISTKAKTPVKASPKAAASPKSSPVATPTSAKKVPTPKIVSTKAKPAVKASPAPSTPRRSRKYFYLSDLQLEALCVLLFCVIVWLALVSKL